MEVPCVKFVIAFLFLFFGGGGKKSFEKNPEISHPGQKFLEHSLGQILMLKKAQYYGFWGINQIRKRRWCLGPIYQGSGLV